LRIPLGSASATLASPKTFWRAESAPTLTLRAAFHTTGASATLLVQPYDELAAGDWAQWGPERAERPAPAAPVAVPLAIEGDGQVRTLEVDLSAHPGYRGGMTQIRLLLPPGPGSAQILAVELVAPSAGTQAAPSGGPPRR
jgi:hypothetical protein